MHLAAPRATLTSLSCSSNFPRAQYLRIRTLTHQLIVKFSKERTYMFRFSTDTPIDRPRERKAHTNKGILSNLASLRT